MNDESPSRAPLRSRREGRQPSSTYARRALPVLLVVAGLLLGAAALRPDGGLLGTGATPVVSATGFVVLIALGWLILVGRFAARFREEVRRLAGPTPWAERLRAAAVVLLGGLAVVVPVLLFAFHNRATSTPTAGGPGIPWVAPQPSLPPATPPPSAAPKPPAESVDLLTILLYLLTAGLGALLLAAVVAVVVLVWRQLRRGPRRPQHPPAIGAAPTEEEVLTAAVATGRRALLGDDARAAGSASYAAMEGSLADSGLARRACDSPTELLERAVTDDRVDPVPAHALTALFREARYSTHPMDDAHVRRAQVALDAIAAHLAARPAEAVPEPASTGSHR